jgi:hypothetical protein
LWVFAREKIHTNYKRRNVCFLTSLSLSLSLSLITKTHSLTTHTHFLFLSLLLFFHLSLSLSHLVVSKMYVRNESNILSYVARSLLYTLSGADMIKAKSLPVLSTVALTP